MQRDASETQASSGPRIALTITPGFLEVRRALAEIRSKLTDVLSEDAIGTLQIVGAEILNNVVEHGFADSSGTDQTIEISAALEGANLVFCVVDNGKPMPGGVLPQPHEREFDRADIDGLPEGGFGWNLIHVLSDELSYVYQDGKNQLRVTIGVRM